MKRNFYKGWCDFLSIISIVVLFLTSVKLRINDTANCKSHSLGLVLFTPNEVVEPCHEPWTCQVWCPYHGGIGDITFFFCDMTTYDHMAKELYDFVCGSTLS